MAGAVIEITDQSFEQEVKKSSVPVLVDFWATWCGPCQRVAPIVEELANENGDKAKLAKVDVDDCVEVASEYGVSSIPTLILFKDGEEKERIVGAQPKSVLQNLINKYL